VSNVNVLSRARDVLDIELEAVTSIRDNLGQPFEELVQACLECLNGGGKLVLAGIGKSAHIGRKLSATLASTGSASAFLYPVEALHGDLGVMTTKDILLALSYSGETEELLGILPVMRRTGVKVVGITGVLTSRLAEWSDLIVPMPVPREACPFNLAPTATTTALLALGDALAMVLLECRGFTREDYGRLHPAGAIGRALTLRARDVIRPVDRTARILPEATVREALEEMTRHRVGSVLVVDQQDGLLGIFTDGDFRRCAQQDLDILRQPISSVMTKNPSTIAADSLAAEVLALVEKKHVDDVPVVDDANRVIGVIDIQDLPGMKLM